MTVRGFLAGIAENETLNYILTNFIPRRTATRLVGAVARIEQPTIKDAAIRVWRMFSDLDLSEAKKTEFSSLRDCFIRELKAGARPIDTSENIVVSPCDGIVVAAGAIEGERLLQVKGAYYTLSELLRDDELVDTYRGGTFVTLRLTASMYHRFHAPFDGCVERVRHIAGDTWNVNPATLKRVSKLYCRNERATVELRLPTGQLLTLVPVAAILVASIKLNFMELPADRSHQLPWNKNCSVRVEKGQEMGWFEHGSTIIVLAPRGIEPCTEVQAGANVRMGQRLLRLPNSA